MDNANVYSYMIDGKPACVSVKAVLLWVYFSHNLHCMCNLQFLIVLHTYSYTIGYTFDRIMQYKWLVWLKRGVEQGL